ncbi:MAG: hypothetical protein WCF57_04740 [Pyrinomonadaceae bacterium]
MKTIKPVLASILIMHMLTALPLCHASAQDAYTFSGHIKTKVVDKTSTPQFSVKLYPPKESGKPVLLTTTDDDAAFEFTDLSEKSYLLEVYLGTDIVYQEVIELNESICCEIDLSGEASKRQCPCARRKR